jgi:hypothetical protein
MISPCFPMFPHVSPCFCGLKTCCGTQIIPMFLRQKIHGRPSLEFQLLQWGKGHLPQTCGLSRPGALKNRHLGHLISQSLMISILVIEKPKKCSKSVSMCASRPQKHPFFVSLSLVIYNYCIYNYIYHYISIRLDWIQICI